MTTHRHFSLEAAHHLADRFRTVRRAGRGWSKAEDRDLQREAAEIQIVAQAGPYRIF
ncbi:MAG TPA: hypothetical protein PLX71_03095 [Phycicoccus sp.]|nr:hypothetical protein [Phycicoccus sp.]